MEDVLSAELASEPLYVWNMAGEKRGLLLVLSEDAFYHCDIAIDVLKKRVFALTVEGIPAEVLLAKSPTIPLKKIISVSGDEKRRTLSIMYSGLTRPASYEVTLPSREIQDEVFTAFRARFGSKCKYRRKVMSPARALVAPIAIALVSVVAGYFMAFVFDPSDYSATGRNVAMKALLAKLIGAIGPIGTFLLGLAGAAVALWWGWGRYRNPPIAVTIRPGK